jgi:hypothetical protein
MAAATTPPTDEAREVFADLGYDVSGEGTEFRAIREWKEVLVTATGLGEAVEVHEDGGYRCFVTWSEQAAGLREHLSRADPEYEWAVIGVDDGGDYEVARAPRPEI